MGMNIELCKHCHTVIRKDMTEKDGTVHHYKLVCNGCKKKQLNKPKKEKK